MDDHREALYACIAASCRKRADSASRRHGREIPLLSTVTPP